MITSVKETDNFEQILLGITNKNNPFACRIISLFNCYNTNLAFVDYWFIIDDITNKTIGALARNGTSFIVCLTSQNGIDEVSSFLRISGAESVICDKKYQLDLENFLFKTGFVLMRNSYINTNNVDYSISTPDIKTSYELLVSCGDEHFCPPAFEDYYVDVNHKLRHNSMRIYGVTQDDSLECVAMTVAESKNGAVIGAVACKNDSRNKGYGSYVVKFLTNQLIKENKIVYLHRAKDENKHFYEKLGFVEIGEWIEYKYKG